MKPKMLCFMGITCVGKDTLAERMQTRWPDDIGLIQVGKEFRRRYPPEFFQGKAAMPSTEKEAWEIFDEQYKQSIDKKIVIVIGQPRLVSQLHELRKRDENCDYYLLTASNKVINDRIDGRFNTGHEGWRTLALDRVTNDKVQLYELLVEMIRLDMEIKNVLDTESLGLDSVAETLYYRYGGRNGR
jgi:hypothetical protein